MSFLILKILSTLSTSDTKALKMIIIITFYFWFLFYFLNFPKIKIFFFFAVMASLQKGGPPSADFFLSNCNNNTNISNSSNRGKLTHASSRHWSPHSRPGIVGSGHGQPPFTTFSAVHSSKASTMDGDKRRLFLDRMKANPLFKRSTKPSPPLTGNNKSTGVEILTDDEVCIVSKVLNQEWNHIFIL